jgi:hypothetical protein
MKHRLLTRRRFLGHAAAPPLMLLNRSALGADDKMHDEPRLRALRWLEQAQEADGHWSSKRWGGSAEWDVGVTSLALLSYAPLGFTSVKGRFKETVSKGMAWLSRNQRADGSFAWNTFDEQGLATFALCEADGLTRSPHIRPLAQRAVDYICKVQPPHGGFGPGGAVEKRDGGMRVTSWVLSALCGARHAELSVPGRAWERCRVFLRNITSEEGTCSERVGDAEATPGATAGGLACRGFLEPLYDQADQEGQQWKAAAKYLLRQASEPAATTSAKNRLVSDLYYTFHLSLAFWGFGAEYSIVARKLCRGPLHRAQVKEEADGKGRPIRGSWNPADHYNGPERGRVYVTALAQMIVDLWDHRCPRP